MKIKTVDVQAKEWFDQVYGNSYFGAVVTINYGSEDERDIKLPFQYGYGDHYQDMAFKAIIKSGLITDAEENESPWRYYERKGIIVRHSKEERCLQREVKNFAGVR